MAKVTTNATRAYPSLPEPGTSIESHSALLRELRQGVEIHERRTNNYLDSFIRVRDLVDLGIIKVQGDQIVLGEVFD